MKAREPSLDEVDFCCFVDFWSLYQETAQVQRSEAENIAFIRALARMDEWYSHAGTVSLLATARPPDWPPGQPTYHEKGWPTMELGLSSLVLVELSALWYLCI